MTLNEKPCRKCGTHYTPKAWEVKRWDYLCKACRRIFQKDYRSERKELGNPVISGRVGRSYFRAYSKTAEERNRNRVREASRRALASGRLERKPCETCGSASSEMHHDTYDNPLNVRWFCHAHHMEHHMAVRLSKLATGAA